MRRLRYMVLYTTARREGTHYYASYTNKREATRRMKQIATAHYGARPGDRAFLVEVIATRAWSK